MLSFCLITRNAADTLPATLECIRPLADEIVVVDSGSTDSTPALLKAAGARVERVTPESHPDWFLEIPNGRGGKEITLCRFDAARNLSFDMAKGEELFWIDADDLIVGIERWPELLQHFRRQRFDAMILPYDYMFDERGNCTTKLLRERLLRRDAGFRWTYPIHEILHTEGKRVGIYEGVRISHRKHIRLNVNQRRNLEVLKIKGDPASPRTLFYLGVEHATVREYQEAARNFEEYIKIAANEDESYQALIMLGEIQRVFGRWEIAIEFYQKAVIVRPDWRDAYIGLSVLFAQREDWGRAAHYGEEARKKSPVMQTSLPQNPHQSAFGWIEPLAKAYRGLGDVPKALDIIREGLRQDPGYPGFAPLEESLCREMNRQTCAASADGLIEGLLRQDDGIRAVQVAEVLGNTSPASALARSTFVRAMAGDLPGRRLSNVDIEGWLKDGRLGWFADWMLDRPGSHLLSFPGCGSGLLARAAHDLFGRTVYAWDPDAGIGTYYPPFSRWSLTAHAVQPHVRPLHWQPPESVDAVVLSEVLEYCASPEETVTWSVTSLRPGGELVVLVPNGALATNGPPATPDNLRLRHFDPRSLRRLTRTWVAPTLIRDRDGAEYLIVVYRKPGSVPRPRRIAFYCPPVPESWDWRTLQTGVGGSEEAVIRMSRTLAARGHEVTVYGDAEGEDGPVRYRVREDYQRADLCVIWRFPEEAIRKRPLEAEWIWLLLEDIVDGDLLAHAAAHVDRILVMSQWHVGLYPSLAPKMAVVGNGVDPAEFRRTDIERDPRKFIWTSCPTRGLDVLLDAWPQIREALPNATLDVYYGFDMIRAILPHKAKEEMAQLTTKIDRIEELKDQPGVTWKGRVGHAAVAEAMLGAGVWCYPNETFPELFSTSAVKAQAAGCWPVIYERAGLAETVAWGWRSKKESLVQDCVQAAMSPQDREPMRRWACEVFDWERAAEQWERLMVVA